MAEKALDQPRVRALVRKSVASGVPQHERMDVESDLGGLGRRLDDLRDHIGRQRAASLRDKHGRRRASGLQLPQRRHLVPVERVHAVDRALFIRRTWNVFAPDPGVRSKSVHLVLKRVVCRRRQAQC